MSEYVRCIQPAQTYLLHTWNDSKTTPCNLSTLTMHVQYPQGSAAKRVHLWIAAPTEAATILVVGNECTDAAAY